MLSRNPQPLARFGGLLKPANVFRRKAVGSTPKLAHRPYHILAIVATVWVAGMELRSQSVVTSAATISLMPPMPSVASEFTYVYTNGYVITYDTNGLPDATNALTGQLPQPYTMIIPCLAPGVIKVACVYPCNDGTNVTGVVVTPQLGDNCYTNLTLWESPDMRAWVEADSEPWIPGWRGGICLCDDNPPNPFNNVYYRITAP